MRNCNTVQMNKFENQNQNQTHEKKIPVLVQGLAENMLLKSSCRIPLVIGLEEPFRLSPATRHPLNGVFVVVATVFSIAFALAGEVCR